MPERSLRRPILAIGLTLGLAVLGLSLSGGASAGAADCRVIAGPPTLYAFQVFAAGRVECTAPVNKIRITVTLEMDGVEVARETRNDCLKRTVCHNGTNVPDAPGNQTWCSRAWASAQGKYLGEVVACEEQEF